jgi:glycosyltransferase involved in cell wall biosynthesis
MADPIKILHLRDTDEVGGPGKTILETFSRIDKDIFSISIGVFRTRAETKETPFILEAKHRGITVHEIRSRNQYDPAIVHGIVKLVNNSRIDILHTHEAMSDFCGLIAAKICRIPIVSTMHGWIANSLKQEFCTKIDKKVARFFDHVIVVNAEMRDVLLKEGVSPEIISVLHNCIVTENYYKDGTTGYISQSVGKEIPRPVIGTLGRLSPEKGHVDFVEAAAIVLAQGFDARFVIVGDGPEEPKIKQLIYGKGLEESVTMAGYLRDPRRVLQDFDLMVLPSYTEGLPNVILEALMMEVPVISTAVGGVPEIISDGEGGVLISPGEPEKIAEAIMGFLHAPGKYKAMARIMKKTVEDKFDFRVRTRKLEKIYHGVL